MKISVVNGDTIIAPEEGKLLRRKGTDEVYEGEMALGYSYFIGGVEQNPPHHDAPEDFEEIDIPVEDEPVVPDEPPEEEPTDTEVSAEEALAIITGQK